MPDKIMIDVPLTGLSTNDDEVLGSMFRENGKVYTWVKNVGSTSLVAAGACAEVITSVVANMGKRVIGPDATLTSTGSLELCAGVPMTAIGPSGSDTGDHGWIQCRGYRQVSFMQSSAATGQSVGAMAIMTSVQPATYPFDMGYDATADSANTANLYHRKVVFVENNATTGPATAGSAIVDIQCR